MPKHDKPFLFAPAAYLEITRKMTLAQQGHYLMLIAHGFDAPHNPRRPGSLTRDDGELWQLAACASLDEWLAIKERVLEGFEVRQSCLLVPLSVCS